MGDLLLAALDQHGYSNTSKPEDCFIQSFDPNALLELSNKTSLPLIYLTNLELTDTQLETLSTFCYGLGVSKTTIVRVNPLTNIIQSIGSFINRTHDLGM